jgi:hypothetical protein
MSRYEPLSRYLQSRREAELPLSFGDVERIVGRELPHSAYEHQPWWANTTTHSHALAWMRVGWKTSGVNLSKRTVRFVRTDPHPPVENPDVPFAARQLSIDKNDLTSGAVRMLEDYAEENECNLGEAATHILNHMARERRRQLVDWFRVNAPRVEGESTD